MALVALLGYFVGYRRRRPASDARVSPLSLDETDALIEKIESISNQLRQSMATHHCTVSRCREQIRVLSESHVSDTDNRPAHAPAGLAGPNRSPVPGHRAGLRRTAPAHSCLGTTAGALSMTALTSLRPSEQMVPWFVAQITNLLPILIGFLLFAERLQHERAMVDDHGQRVPLYPLLLQFGRMSDT